MKRSLVIIRCPASSSVLSRGSALKQPRARHGSHALEYRALGVQFLVANGAEHLAGPGIYPFLGDFQVWLFRAVTYPFS